MYLKINKALIDEKIDVGVCKLNNRYYYEIGVDMPLAHDIFNEQALLEVMQLKEKMLREKAVEIFKCIPMRMEKFYEKFDK